MRVQFKTSLLVCILIVLVGMTLVMSFSAFDILPGTGLVSKRGVSEDPDQVLIFEHTERGTGGLVLNRPTPIHLRDLNIPTFQAFGSNSLMLGCGMQNSDDGTNIAIGDMSPWFWIHDIDGLSGSFALDGAAGTLYMGGNIEEATRVLKKENLDPAEHFKFFHKYRKWDGSELKRQVESGFWEVQAQDCKAALRPYSMTL